MRVFGTHPKVADDSMLEGPLRIKIGSAKYTTPPDASCSLHLQASLQDSFVLLRSFVSSRGGGGGGGGGGVGGGQAKC
jgi:hypothetical protein